MSLRARFLAYLAGVHLLLALVGAALLRRNRLWLLVVEVVFLASLAAGATLTRRLFGTLALVGGSAAFLRENDYTTRIRETGQADVDALIGVYNRMVDSLRQERLRLQEQHHLLGAILEVSPSGFMTLDFDGRIDFVNRSAEALLGRSADRLRGLKLDALESPLAAAISGLEARAATVVALGDGRRIKCHRGASLDRGFPRAFVLLEELTEEVHIYEKAAYEKIIRMMSHEVNNSVAASNSLLHSCLTYARHLPEEDQRDFSEALQVAIARTEKLSAFMKGFADVVRLPGPVPQPCALRPLLEDVARLMRPAAEKAGVALRAEAPDDAAPVPLDRGQMEQVLVNVVKNAIEAAGPGGRVTLGLRNGGGRVHIVVEDSGPGIDAAAGAHLFTPFFTTKPGGQGIGLTLVREILRHHHFDFSLEGPPGGPTRFTITL